MHAKNATHVRLGRSGLEVCRIGLGGGNSIGPEDVEYAVSRGVNYLFTSLDLHAPMYQRSWPAIRRIKQGPRRDEVVLVVCSYVADAEKIGAMLLDQLYALRLDHVDVFQWGWVTQANDPAALITVADAALRRNPVFASMVAKRLQIAEQVARELQSRGYARHLAISTHDRAVARAVLDDPRLDILMVRYNVAHRGAEDDVFAYLPDERETRPGIVTFNSAHDARGLLTRLPPGLPEGLYQPEVADLYRFCLDQPDVDVLLTGPGTRAELDAALAVLERPEQSARLRTYLENYGDLHAGRATVAHA